MLFENKASNFNSAYFLSIFDLCSIFYFYDKKICNFYSYFNLDIN